jgi:hypothetical protein
MLVVRRAAVRLGSVRACSGPGSSLHQEWVSGEGFSRKWFGCVGECGWVGGWMGVASMFGQCHLQTCHLLCIMSPLSIEPVSQRSTYTLLDTATPFDSCRSVGAGPI